MMVMTIVDQVSYSVFDIIEDDGDLRSMCTHSSKAQPLANSMNTTPYGLPTDSLRECDLAMSFFFLPSFGDGQR
jgi:hypothetical protein